jgi:hypothetical protein
MKLETPQQHELRTMPQAFCSTIKVGIANKYTPKWVEKNNAMDKMREQMGEVEFQKNLKKLIAMDNKTYAKNLVEEIKKQLATVKYQSLLYTTIDIKINASEDCEKLIIELQDFAKFNYESVRNILGLSLTNQIKNFRYLANKAA